MMRASALRSVPCWLLVAATLLAIPAKASPSDDPDLASKINVFLGKVRTQVVQTAAKHPEWARYIPRGPASTTEGHSPWRLPDLGLPTGRGMSAADLDRILIGYQAGILKIVGRDGRVLFVKRRPGSDMVGIDSVEYAPIDDEQRHEILAALGIGEGDAEAAANGLMERYGRLPHTKAIAVLGAIAAGPLAPDCGSRIRAFLVRTLRDESDVKVHRMAVLSLAVATETDERTAHAVIDFMDRSPNAWETFTTQQYFRYHRDEVRSYFSAGLLRQRLAHTRNPYGPRIAAEL
jgi:hypothetical protein